MQLSTECSEMKVDLSKLVRDFVQDGIFPADVNLPASRQRLGLSVDFVNSESELRKELFNSDGSTNFVGIWTFPDHMDKNSGGGITTDDWSRSLINKFLRRFPGTETLLAKEFTEKVRQQWGFHIQHEVEDWFRTQTEKPFSQLVGYRESQEWIPTTLVRVLSSIVGDNPSWTRNNGLVMPFRVKAIIQATKKKPVGHSVGPFSNMSDQELNVWILVWKEDAPENFWMDGELRLTLNHAIAFYRKQWRAKTPREQTNLLESLMSSGHRVASPKRVATRFETTREPGVSRSHLPYEGTLGSS
jgi:hypothetical protein